MKHFFCYSSVLLICYLVLTACVFDLKKMDVTEDILKSKTVEAVKCSFREGFYKIHIRYKQSPDRHFPSISPAVPGIGSASILMDQTLDVDRVWVTLEMRGLENFTINSEKKSYRIGLRQESDKWHIDQAYRAANTDRWISYTETSSFIIPVIIDGGNWKPEKQIHTFEIEIPKDIWEDRNLPFDISWINFYR